MVNGKITLKGLSAVCVLGTERDMLIGKKKESIERDTPLIAKNVSAHAVQTYIMYPGEEATVKGRWRKDPKSAISHRRSNLRVSRSCITELMPTISILMQLSEPNGKKTLKISADEPGRRAAEKGLIR